MNLIEQISFTLSKRGSRFALMLGLLLQGLLAQNAQGAEQRFALVVGYNNSDDLSLKPLSYADDDALRYAELLAHVSTDLVTLTELDEESQRLWGTVKATPPTRQGVLNGLEFLKTKMAKAEADGDQALLYFVYTGHGNYDAEGRGYVHLKDGRFTTRDLYHHVIAPNQTRQVILIVDACNAALLVHSRGGTERRVAGPSTLRLERYPNVGVILASSAVGEVHEWGRFLAGVFSHEVRSGLLGAADLNDDERITFGELASFVAAANERVTNPNIHLTPYIRPPLQQPNIAVIDLKEADFAARVRVDHSLSGRAHLVDEHLVRHADFHKSKEQAFWLALPNAGTFVLVQEETEYRIPKGASGRLQLTDLEVQERTVISARGAGSDYFDRTLFHETYSQGFAERYLQDRYMKDLEVRRLVQLPWYLNAGAWSVLGAGATALFTGIGLHVTAEDMGKRSFQTQWSDERHSYNQKAGHYQTGAAVLYGVGGAAIVGSALWFILDKPLSEERYQPPIRVDIGPNGIMLQTDL
jgi:hypothetical protein